MPRYDAGMRRNKTRPRHDPFAGAKPLKNPSILIGGLPDERTAEEILADLRARHRRRPSA